MRRSVVFVDARPARALSAAAPFRELDLQLLLPSPPRHLI
jgi:hypothetical protein